MQEFTFQCIISYIAENEDAAYDKLMDTLEDTGPGLFDLIQVNNIDED